MLLAGALAPLSSFAGAAVGPSRAAVAPASRAELVEIRQLQGLEDSVDKSVSDAGRWQLEFK